MVDETIEYYDSRAVDFARDTLKVDMNTLYAPFLAQVPAGGSILDAGCGAGRDARAFAQAGYRVTAFDASPALVAVARDVCGLAVACLRFESVDWVACFDGVWACASLLHVPRPELGAALSRLGLALVPGGVLYASFKYGTGERQHGGRRFTDLDEVGIATLLTEVALPLRLEQTWVTGDRRPGREAESWLNLLVRRSDSL